MHDILHQWARTWGIHPEAVLDLLNHLGAGYEPYAPVNTEGFSEAAMSQVMRLAAAKAGIYAWRNQVGALMDANGRLIRYGLCNDTKAMNESVKSSDYVGIKTVTITADMVGQRFGQFWAREMKPYGWVYTGQGREPAQLKFHQIVLSAGGDAAFSTGGI